MTDLVAFLRDRLADDEQVATKASERGGPTWERGYRRETEDYDGTYLDDDDNAISTPQDATIVYDEGRPLQTEADHIARWDPARVLAEVQAKRAILDAATDYSPELEHGDNGEWAFEVVLQQLALAYQDHPDYRQEWRP